MSEELMKDAIEMFRNGDIKGAVAELEGKLKSNGDVAQLHHSYAEFANMLNMEEQDDVIPGDATKDNSDSDGSYSHLTSDLELDFINLEQMQLIQKMDIQLDLI